MKKFLALMAIGGAAALGLTACNDNEAVGVHERNIRLQDGRVLHCIDYGRGGSCDWDHPVVAK